jgi:hypothetical protein
MIQSDPIEYIEQPEPTPLHEEVAAELEVENEG